MISGKVLSLLKSINFQDFQCNGKQVKTIAYAGEDQRQVFIYCNQKNYSFKAIGSPYLLGMTKWIVMQLQNGQLAFLTTLDITKLQYTFDLPAHKRQDALIILQLIEQVK